MADMIVTEHENVPVAETVAPHAVTLAPALMLLVTVVPGVKPVPAIEVETPEGPRVGVRVMWGVVTVNAAVALSKLPSEPVAVTV